MTTSLAAPASARRLDWGRVTLWSARTVWLLVALVGGRAVGAAVDGRSDAVRWVTTIGAWTGWEAGALALAVTAVATLTAVRAVVPLALVAAAATAVFGAGAGDIAALAVPAAVASVLVGAADTGQAYVQASAYGDERRFGLRPPLGYLVPTIVSWVVWAVALVTAPLAWAARSWVLAAVATVVLAAATAVLPRRWHQLSRRWFVAVPAGIVVHDPVVMADTLMVMRARVAGVRLVAGARDPGVLDLSGPTAGIAMVVTLDEMTTAVFAPRRATPRGTAVHVGAFSVTPSRPGSVVRELARRGLPVH